MFEDDNSRLSALHSTKSENVQNMKSQHSFLREKTQSNFQDSSKQSSSNTTTIKETSPFLKQKSLSNLPDSSKQLHKVNVDTGTWHRRISNSNIVCDETLLKDSNDIRSKVRVSSGSFFYGQVVAQQQLQAIQNSTMNARPFENVCPDIKTQSRFFGAHQVRGYFDMPIQQVIFLIFWFQVCVSMHIYYSIMTLKYQLCV